jgi:transposase
MRSKGSAQVLEIRRRLAVRRLNEGYSTAEVADFLEVHDRTARKWAQRYRLSGDAGLTGKRHAGPRPRLTDAQQMTVLQWFARNPAEFGYRTELWTAARAAEQIRKSFKVRYNPRYLSQWLYERGITPQKPVTRPRERNDEEIARWVKEEWKRIRRKACRRKAHIALIDESGFLMMPLVRRSLAPRGQPLVLKHKAKHRQKVSVAAALTVSPMAGRAGLYFRTYPDSYVDAEKSARFVRQLLRHLRGEVIIVWDKGNMHKGPHIRKLLSDFPRLSLEPLPSYAPDLNAVEHLWSYGKYGKLSNYAATDVPELNRRVTAVLRASQKNPSLLHGFFDLARLPFPKRPLAA